MSQPAVSELILQASEALAVGDYEQADSLCLQILDQNPGSVTALMLAGESAMKAQRFEEALDFFGRVPQSGTDDSVTALFSAAEVSRAIGHPSAAEGGYRAVLKWRPSHLNAHERLAFLLDMQGRRWEAIPHSFELLRQGRISFSTLIRLGSRDSAVPFPDELEKIRQANRDLAVLKLSEAVDALAHFEPATAERLLWDTIELKPELVEAHARLGLLLADQDVSRLPDWHDRLPSKAGSHPDVWVARGFWCRHAGQIPASIRCFGEAARRDPDQRIAHYQLGQLLAEADRSELAERFAERARLLQKLAAGMNQLSLNRQDAEAMKAVSVVLEKLGRYREAHGWYLLSLSENSRAESGSSARSDRLQFLKARLSPALPQTVPEATPSTLLDLSNWPLPDWPTSRETDQLSTDGRKNSDPGLRFVDRATEFGLQFTYFNADDPASVGTKMYEFAGGGVGVIDFDADGLPDLHLTQGCSWPPENESRVHRDGLFQNLGEGRCRNVSDFSGTGDGWFSQGVAVGDLNNDGFSDLYVANIGRNRLYLNNGDGTFLDLTDHSGISGQQWTTSCLIADLNGDQSPDIYDVNYLKGDDLFDRLCMVEGQRRACAPSVFPAERDRILLSRQDGQLDEVTGNAAAFFDPPRAGLGIVAADMDESGRLSLFVANDVSANAFLVNETASGSHNLAFHENALLAGLAFDRDGRAQACMGVAADDVDGNGLVDFFVTNYYEEGNSLYLQSAPGVFAESSRTAGLYEPSFRQLGFGTQFLDGNLDGRLELVVANGHLDDFGYLDIPFRMRPQLFSDQGDATFRELSPDDNYFGDELLGRSIATVDWNRDGRPDFVTSHLESPVSLLVNQTEPTGHWVGFRLRGVSSSRDAIGTTVTVKCGGQSWTRQLTAGSGYQASNEQMLLFGLADYEQIDWISVRWPSGSTQTFLDRPVDRHVVLIEGAETLVELP